MDQANLNDTVVTAPFDGLITNVTATDGAIINKGNVAVTMTNPNNLEADVLVNEIDIFNVKINGTATVSVDAASGVRRPRNRHVYRTDGNHFERGRELQC